ncbi:MAG: hypothetical protein HQL69_12460, partial [Magnetococcales bacterium]|nr:hypothetical protein [Magnetococcales bacterium]
MKYINMLKHYKYGLAPATKNKPKMVASFSSISIPVSGFIQGISGGRACNFLVGKAETDQTDESENVENSPLEKIKNQGKNQRIKIKFVSGFITNS